MRIHTGLTMTNDDKTSQLHEEHFGDVSTTDTMSFPMNEVGPDGEYYLGDIVVNFDQVQRTAEELSISEKEELARLITHSALHLMGMDDETEEGFEQMKESENWVMGKIFKKYTSR